MGALLPASRCGDLGWGAQRPQRIPPPAAARSSRADERRQWPDRRRECWWRNRHDRVRFQRRHGDVVARGVDAGGHLHDWNSRSGEHGPTRAAARCRHSRRSRTARGFRRPPVPGLQNGNIGEVRSITMLPNDAMDTLFEATIEATEEAIMNALVAARTMTGIDHRTILALDHEQLREVLRRHNRLSQP